MIKRLDFFWSARAQQAISLWGHLTGRDNSSLAHLLNTLGCILAVLFMSVDYLSKPSMLEGFMFIFFSLIYLSFYYEGKKMINKFKNWDVTTGVLPITNREAFPFVFRFRFFTNFGAFMIALDILTLHATGILGSVAIFCVGFCYPVAIINKGPKQSVFSKAKEKLGEVVENIKDNLAPSPTPVPVYN